MQSTKEKRVNVNIDTQHAWIFNTGITTYIIYTALGFMHWTVNICNESVVSCEHWHVDISVL